MDNIIVGSSDEILKKTFGNNAPDTATSEQGIITDELRDAARFLTSKESLEGLQSGPIKHSYNDILSLTATKLEDGSNSMETLLLAYRAISTLSFGGTLEQSQVEALRDLRETLRNIRSSDFPNLTDKTAENLAILQAKNSIPQVLKLEQAAKQMLGIAPEAAAPVPTAATEVGERRPDSIE